MTVSARLADRGRQEALKRVRPVAVARGRSDPRALLARWRAGAGRPESRSRPCERHVRARFFAGLLSQASRDVMRSRAAEERREVVAAATTADRAALRPARLPRAVLRRPDRLASRSGVVSPVAARALEPARCARPGDGRRQQGRLGAQSSSVDRAAGAGVGADARRTLCRRLCVDDRVVARDQSARRRDQLGQQPRSLVPPDVVVLGRCCSFAMRRLSTGSWALTPGGGLGSTHVRAAVSLVLLLANTHLTGEALGLFYAGLLFPEFRDAPHWRELGCACFAIRAAAQVSDDGVHFEQSTCYQRYTVDTYLAVRTPRRRAMACRCRATCRTRLESMVEFLVAMRGQTDHSRRSAMSTAGALCPLVRRREIATPRALAVAAALFRRSDFAWAAGGGAPELLWLLGPDGLARSRRSAASLRQPVRPDCFRRAATR